MSGWKHDGGPCPKCQEPVKPGATRCPHCRANLAPAVRTMWIVIAALVVALLVAGWFWRQSSKRRADDFVRCIQVARDPSTCHR